MASRAKFSLKAPFLRSIELIPEKMVPEAFPFTLPYLRGGAFELVFRNPVTIFVGENGTGKSTLLEAIAGRAGFNAEGGSRDNSFRTGDGDDYTGLAAALRPSWLPKVGKGFFFRAETFYNFATYIERTYGEDGRRTPWTERGLHRHSHGEVFLSFFEGRFGSTEKSIYLLDEPEAALSPERQLEFLAMVEERRASGNVQFIIATHSPLLMASPGAEILMFGHRGIRRGSLAETPHFRLYRDFLRDPEVFLDEALQRIGAERAELLAELGGFRDYSVPGAEED